MRKRMLSLALALALCLGLSVPTMAAGEKKVVTDEEHGVIITMDGFLREETHRYVACNDYLGGKYRKWTLMVVADNSTVTVEAMEGRGYVKTEEDEDYFYENYWKTDTFAYRQYVTYVWDSGEKSFSGISDAPYPLTEPYTVTMAPAQGEGESDGVHVSADYSVHVICESDFAKLVPVDGKPIIAASWAQGALENAYDVGLFPNGTDPFEDDCAQGMTRAQFASVAVNLYSAMGGILPEVEYNDHPFSDVSSNYDVIYAYNLGLVSGTSATTFSPQDTLTREQAAVLLSNVYAKLRGAIPQVSVTGFTDDGSVSSWAKTGVAFMSDQGIVSGVGGGKFAPQQTLSIQEAVVMAQKMLEKLK